MAPAHISPHSRRKEIPWRQYAIEKVIKTYVGSDRPAVDDVSLDIDDATFVVLIGPSGCGKTTLMKMTNRLIEPTSGLIEVGHQNISSVPVNDLRRRMGYVIQQVGLFPHVKVKANIATVPRLLRWPESRINERVDELLDLVGLPPAQYRNRYPKMLSGGQQQRVGLARALAADPDILLMDEPFGAIDAITRSRLQDQLIQIQRRVRKTVLFVTHDVDEALKLADKLVVMSDGRVVQYDSPFNVVTRPANDFVRALLNTDDVLRTLSLVSVGSAMGPVASRNGSPHIDQGRSLRDALSLMIAEDARELAVVNGEGSPIGELTLETVRGFGKRSTADEISTTSDTA